MMSRHSKEQVLREHGIETRVIDSRLEALDVFNCEDGEPCEVWLDVEDWTRREIGAWLGY
jgi:hypothetical protein